MLIYMRGKVLSWMNGVAIYSRYEVDKKSLYRVANNARLSKEKKPQIKVFSNTRDFLKHYTEKKIFY